MIDLETQTAEQLDIPQAHGLIASMGFIADGRAFLQSPAGHFESENVIHEVLDDGSVQPVLEFTGLSTVIAPLAP